MNDSVQKYLKEIQSSLSTGLAHEHTHRIAFQRLIEVINPNIKVLNEPSRSEHGSPDFVFTHQNKTGLVLGYVETKDVGVDLDKVINTEQLKRYLGYSNLILTNYIEFRFFRNGEQYNDPIIVANLEGSTIFLKPENFTILVDTLTDFIKSRPEPIKSGKRLAEIMGGKARRIRDNVHLYLSLRTEKDLASVYETIKRLLVHDLTSESFADLYAQTLVYGLFVARYHDESPGTFSRQEARDLIPASNPFLRHFFDHIVGPDFDTRLTYIVNELCEVFQLADVQALMHQYFKTDLWGQEHTGPDPVIHFYEDFLHEYDPELRKRMGAYYTPLPVVKFIIRSIDYLLEKEFNLSSGLADTIKVQGVHQVQILDPAVGTGTFLNEVIRSIHARFKTQQGRWGAYVHHELLPRIHGFELMMAPYTIAHLKLSMLLKETGFHYFNETRSGTARLGIYLTNSLEEGIAQQGELFSEIGLAGSIAEESEEALRIKNEKPIMVIVGNPPYSVSSSNKGEWIQNLIKEYKKNLNERKINLDDDYIKFIRFAEHFIEKNSSGIVAMITNNSFIDGITHRQMRKHLLETFDDIYILNLHGNLKKKETAPDGGRDENIFDIQQGVSINIFVRKMVERKGLGRVYHADLHGKRIFKFEELNKNSLESFKWQKINYTEPYYFFVPKDFNLAEEYNNGFKIDELLTINSSGIETQKDSLVIQFNDTELNMVRSDLESDENDNVYLKYKIKDSRDWNLRDAREDLPNARDTQIMYRPFDKRWTFYSGKTKGILAYPRDEVMRNLIRQNLSLLLAKRVTSFDNWQHVFISEDISERCSVSLQTGEVGYAFPLYLYYEDGTKIPNLKKEIVDKIENITGKVSPENIFDYIYAILYSPSYREKYKEFLKIDFPRVPFPKDIHSFKKLVGLGKELRKLHLLESPKANEFVTIYPEMGNDIVGKLIYKDGKVYINNNQYFGKVPEIAWNFWIGGYQPAQKWLKDRRGRVLTNEDIEHYQKIIKVLVETDLIMKEINKLYSKIENDIFSRSL